ncbi:MAG TPA: ABC-2 family transporter protein [Anaerolineales bacterium]|nr:ABC-2 family transporter protein [Anaerolineales bacterium]
MKIFWSFTRQAFQFIAAYRFDFFAEILLTLLRMYSVYWVWRILYTQRPGAFGVDMQQMITYGVLGMALEIFMWSRPQHYMARQVKSGAIDTDLMKPLDFHLHMLARSVGETLVGLTVLAIPALAIAYFVLGVNLPPNSLTAFLFGISLILGYLVLFHLNFLIGSLAIVALDIRHINWAYYSMVRFFGGQLVPLWLFPPWLAWLAGALPFQSTYFIPMSIYIGTFAGAEAIQAIAFQGVWLVVLVLLSRILWNWAYRRLVVQGG